MPVSKKHSYHKRLREFEAYDEIVLKVVPRFKTSGLSGDEWRTNVQAKFLFKGREIESTIYLDMSAALHLLGYDWIRLQEPISDNVIKIEQEMCDQPGCAELATVKVVLNKVTSEQGEFLDPEEYKNFEYYRQFCDNHVNRGDSDREDNDDNMKEVERPAKAKAASL